MEQGGSDNLKLATENLTKASHKLAEVMYQSARAGAQQQQQSSSKDDVSPIVQCGKSWHARWTLATAAGEHEQIASLVRGIPPVALAFGTKHDTPPKHDRRAVIDDFLGAIADRLMRDAAPKAFTARTASLHD